MSSSWSKACQSKLIDPRLLPEVVKEIRKTGRKIATLNGSFDLLHAGHLHMLYEAALAADVLIVLLNTDASIQQYKGPDRPIVPLEYRRELIAALGFVDYVTWFSETDPCQILRIIQPDVHVNGAEYGEDCIEAETVKAGGGRIKIVDLIPGLSTSAILKKILEEQPLCAS